MERVTVFGPERFALAPDADEVFAWLGCAPELPCYETFRAAWPQAAALAKQVAEPRAALCREGAAMTVFLTLGEAAERQADALFARREYVLASLLNTVLDELLFHMDRQAAAILGEEAARDGLYIAARLEPSLDYPLAEQRRLFAPIQRALPFARVSDTGVLHPAKSMMYRVTLSEHPCSASSLHDCSRCSQPDCPYRSAPKKETSD